MSRLIEAMKACMQTPTQNVLEHRRSVVAHFSLMTDHIRHGTSLPSWWRLPAWAVAAGILDNLPPDCILREYHEFHDCGKPFCRTMDEDGRAHYPGHANMSERVWLAAGGDAHAARLMAQDMDAHLLRADGQDEFARKADAVTLLLTALAETHSNAAMFGGTDSDGFKIKCKNLDKRGRAVMALRATHSQSIQGSMP